MGEGGRRWGWPWSRCEREMFVGRKAELSSLAAELDLVRSGMPRVVCIEGDPGMGKSRLVQRFLQGQTDLHTLRSSGDEDEARLPYGIVDQLVAGYNLGSRRNRPAAMDDPLAVGAELLQVLGEIEREAPVAVVVDDVQWADTPSLRALTFALRRLHADSVLAIVTNRPDEASLPEGLARLIRNGGRRIHLAGLSVAELGALAAALGIDDLARGSLARLRDHTGGNPLHARTLLEELDREALRRHSGPLPAPRSFRPLVAARLASLGAEACALVQAVSVLGPRCLLDDACRLVATTDPAGALEEAIEVRLLTLQDRPAGREVSFAHPLLRAAVYHDLGPAERSRLHLASAALLPPPAALEHRAAAALIPDASLAHELAALAEHESTTGSWVTASGHFLLAGSVAADPTAREDYVLNALEVLIDAGDVSEAAALAEHHLTPATDTPRRRYVLGHTALLRGEYGVAERLLESVWDDPGAPPAAALKGLAADRLALLSVIQCRAADIAVWAERALGATPDLPADAFTHAVREAQAALTHPEKGQPLGATPEGVAALLGRGVARCWTGDLAAARADLQAALGAAGVRPASVPALLAAGYLAETDYRQGHWDDAAVRAELAVSLATDTGQDWALPFLLSVAAAAPSARGQWDAAEASVRAASGHAARSGDPASLVYAATADAYLGFCAFDPARVLRAAAPLRRRAGPSRAWAYEPGVTNWLELYAQALIERGELAEGAQVVARLEAAAVARQRPVPMGVAARLRGAIAAARGDVEDALDAFERAAHHLSAVPVPFEHALLDFAHGRVLRRAGSRRDAAAKLHAAGQVFAALSAAPFVERTDRELAASGLAPRARMSPATALTPQELAVARLAASHKTNKEVAEELIVSVKTVEYHLSHVYAKLGLRSRRELAARLTAHLPGLPPGPGAPTRDLP